MRIYAETGVPVLFDVFHHELNHSGSSSANTLAGITKTWQERDGIPMIDYSHHRSGGRKVSHTESIDSSHFERFLATTQPYDVDIMLEIKDKETSALKAVEIARKDRRFFHAQTRS
jgi:UV DNA damage endonuclease